MKITRLLTTSTLSAALALSGMSLVSCKKDHSTTGEAAQQAQGGFAEAFNELIDEPQGLIKDYFGEVPDDGPDPKDPPHLRPPMFTVQRALDTAKKALDGTKGNVPTSMKDMPPLADAALAAANKLVTAYTAASKYYTAEDYKDDAFAKGKTLHADMQTARTEFKTAINAFETALDAVENVQNAAELAKQTKDTYGWWFRTFNTEAKKFVGVVGAAGTPEQFRKAVADGYKPFDDAYNSLTAFAATKGDKLNVTFKNYLDSVERMHVTAKKLQRDAPTAKDDSLDTDSLISDYNGLVTMADTLRNMEVNSLLK